MPGNKKKKVATKKVKKDSKPSLTLPHPIKRSKEGGVVYDPANASKIADVVRYIVEPAVKSAAFLNFKNNPEISPRQFQLMLLASSTVYMKALESGVSPQTALTLCLNLAERFYEVDLATQEKLFETGDATSADRNDVVDYFANGLANSIDIGNQNLAIDPDIITVIKNELRLFIHFYFDTIAKSKEDVSNLSGGFGPFGDLLTGPILSSGLSALSRIGNFFAPHTTDADFGTCPADDLYQYENFGTCPIPDSGVSPAIDLLPNYYVPPSSFIDPTSNNTAFARDMFSTPSENFTYSSPAPPNPNNTAFVRDMFRGDFATSTGRVFTNPGAENPSSTYFPDLGYSPIPGKNPRADAIYATPPRMNLASYYKGNPEITPIPQDPLAEIGVQKTVPISAEEEAFMDNRTDPNNKFNIATPDTEYTGSIDSDVNATADDFKTNETAEKDYSEGWFQSAFKWLGAAATGQKTRYVLHPKILEMFDGKNPYEHPEVIGEKAGLPKLTMEDIKAHNANYQEHVKAHNAFREFADMLGNGGYVAKPVPGSTIVPLLFMFGKHLAPLATAAVTFIEGLIARVPALWSTSQSEATMRWFKRVNKWFSKIVHWDPEYSHNFNNAMEIASRLGQGLYQDYIQNRTKMVNLQRQMDAKNREIRAENMQKYVEAQRFLSKAKEDRAKDLADKRLLADKAKETNDFNERDYKSKHDLWEKMNKFREDTQEWEDNVTKAKYNFMDKAKKQAAALKKKQGWIDLIGTTAKTGLNVAAEFLKPILATAGGPAGMLGAVGVGTAQALLNSQGHKLLGTYARRDGILADEINRLQDYIAQHNDMDDDDIVNYVDRMISLDAKRTANMQQMYNLAEKEYNRKEKYNRNFAKERQEELKKKFDAVGNMTGEMKTAINQLIDAYYSVPIPSSEIVDAVTGKPIAPTQEPVRARNEAVFDVDKYEKELPQLPNVDQLYVPKPELTEQDVTLPTPDFTNSTAALKYLDEHIKPYEPKKAEDTTSKKTEEKKEKKKSVTSVSAGTTSDTSNSLPTITVPAKKQTKKVQIQPINGIRTTSRSNPLSVSSSIANRLRSFTVPRTKMRTLINSPIEQSFTDFMSSSKSMPSHIFRTTRGSRKTVSRAKTVTRKTTKTKSQRRK